MEPTPIPSVDGLLPPDIAHKVEDVGVRKAQMRVAPMFLLSILAGAFIAMGCVFCSTALTGSSALPFGVARILGGLVFSLGLILVVVAGAELFTGNNLLVMAWVSRKITTEAVLRNWVVVYLGNFAGSVATALIMYATEQHMMGDGQVGLTALKIAQAKCELGLAPAFTRGIYCNALVCLAVWLCYGACTNTDRILAILFPITAFVACGFEHCVANMYFIPMGIALKSVAASVPDGVADALTMSNFIFRNLIPSTLGNIIGGSLVVGGAYWVSYLLPETQAFRGYTFRRNNKCDLE